MVKQRVLFIVPSLRRAGAEVQVVQLVNGLPVEQFEKYLVCYLEDEGLRDEVHQESVHYHHFPRSRKLDLVAARKIARLIDDERIDTVHCTLENALLYGVLAARYSKRQPTIICAIHTTKQPSWKHVVADVLLYRFLLKKCEQVWFMSETQAKAWINRLPFLKDRHRVIYNGIDCDDFDPECFIQEGREFRMKLEIPQSAHVICCVAGLRPEKLHVVLLRSFRKLREMPGADCYLLLAGAGPMENELRRLADELELGSKIRFLGGLSDVRPLLAASDCKVLCSAAETFSMAMLEAMSMCVPVLATRIGGSGDAITDGRTGILITPGNVDELAEKLKAILSDPAGLSKMGMRARETVSERFSYTKMIEQSGINLASVGASRKRAQSRARAE